MESSRDSTKNLKAQAIDSLFSQLLDWATNNLRIILKSSADSILHMKPNGKRVLQADENKIVLIKLATKTSNDFIEFHLGFPFPCFSREVERDAIDPSDTFSQYAVSVYLHQAPIHTLLRRFFIENLKLSFPSSQHKSIAFQDINYLSESIRAHYDVILFVDPFRFVGDSIMHLRNLDNVLSSVTFSKVHKITSNRPCDAYAGFEYVELEELADFIKIAIQNCSSLTVIPNYIDDQWEVSEVACQAVLSSEDNATALILGRNILVENGRGKHPIVIDLAEKDFTIWDRPVYENIDSACEVFVSTLSRQNSIQLPSRRFKVFINPFTSDPIKDLPARLVIDLVTHLAKLGGTELIVASGFSKQSTHVAYTRHVQSRVDLSSSIEFYEYESFADMSYVIEACNLVITGDTSTAHLAHRHGVPSIVIYNRRNWDQRSWASLMHHSPFGFCSISPWQIPMVVDAFDSITSAEVADLSRAIDGICKAFVNRQDKRFWEKADTVYDKLHAIYNGDLPPKVVFEKLAELWRVEGLSVWWATAWFTPFEIKQAILNERNRPDQKALLLKRFLQLSPLSKLAQIKNGVV